MMRRDVLIRSFACLLVAGLMAGCGSHAGRGATAVSAARDGPLAKVPVRLEPGTYDGQPAFRVVTAHYLIETTIQDEELAGSLGELMEGALEQYRRLAPDVPPSAQPMLCHIFASRTQWAGYTKVNAGPDAEVYLQINRGGYTAGDRYVAYFIGDVGTWSVAAHEGWHQYVARHFKRRPPPFLEEGLACMFEDVTWDEGLPRWNFASNGHREGGLRKSLSQGVFLPLEQLCTMHAGQVVNTSGARIEGFYSESWAFARFLWDGEGGRYRPALVRMLTDLALGQLPPELAGRPDDVPWDPRAAKPLLEHYLGSSLGELDREFQVYAQRLADRSVPSSPEG